MTTKGRKTWKAIDYIRKGWTQRAEARTASGTHCRASQRSAVSWCAIGAIYRAYPVGDRGPIFRKLRDVIGDGFISEWNDAKGRTKREVLAAFRKAGI